VIAGMALLFFPAKAKRAMYGFSLVAALAGFGISLLLLKGDFSEGQFQFIERVLSASLLDYGKNKEAA